MAAKRKRFYTKTLERLNQGSSDDAKASGGLGRDDVVRPPGPMVRPGLPVGPRVHEDIPLDAAAKRAFLAENPDGSPGFQIEIKDELFDKLRCAIDLREGGQVEATFFVVDDNLRRLLEAETPRLRSQLEMRGLKVSSVKVVVV